jgi:hypothetical protein
MGEDPDPADPHGRRLLGLIPYHPQDESKISRNATEVKTQRRHDELEARNVGGSWSNG